MFLKGRLHRLRSQLTFTFLVGFVGIGAAIGLPVVLLISQQSSSHAQLLLDQAVVASRAFLEGERSDLQSLALLISQRPTLMRLLEEQNFSSLESYLDTLRESANLDLILVCSNENEITERAGDWAALCEEDAQSGYAPLPSGSTLVLYATGDVSTDPGTPYKVIIGKNASSILCLFTIHSKNASISRHTAPHWHWDYSRSFWCLAQTGSGAGNINLALMTGLPFDLQSDFLWRKIFLDQLRRLNGYNYFQF